MTGLPGNDGDYFWFNERRKRCLRLLQDLGQISHLVGSIGVLQEITSVELSLAAEQLPIGLQLQVVETGGECTHVKQVTIN